MDLRARHSLLPTNYKSPFLYSQERPQKKRKTPQLESMAYEDLLEWCNDSELALEVSKLILEKAELAARCKTYRGLMGF